MPTGDALQALLRELRRRFPADADAREVEIWLASLGYDARQVDEVRLALAAEVASGAAPDEGEAAAALAGPPVGAEPAEWPPIRVAAPYERARFAPEAWGHLLQLRAAGLDGVDFEQLVDRALLQVDGRIAVDDLRTLLASGAGGEEPPGTGSGTVH
jgi:Smg protein